MMFPNFNTSVKKMITTLSKTMIVGKFVLYVNF